MRIVIAEDQFLLRQGLENLFTRHGFEVVAAVMMGRRSRMRCSPTARMLR